MPEEPVPVRQERLRAPVGPGVRESAPLREHIKLAAKANEDKIEMGRAVVREAEEEFGAVTEEDLALVRRLWPAN